MIWFSSDFHFAHTNIAGPSVSQWKDGYRDFESLHDMNKTLTQTINKYVKHDDVLYFLGDFCFGGHRNTPTYRHSIVCQTIHVCRGNHDKHIDKYSELFTSINDTIFLRTPDTPIPGIFMSHYAHKVWPEHHRGSVCLYGHSHNSIPELGRSMDVGVDSAYWMTGEYRPFSLQEVVDIMKIREPHKIDHHDKNTNP